MTIIMAQSSTSNTPVSNRLMDDTMLETPVFMHGLGTPLEMAGLMLEMDRREGWGVAL
jgi:hypothetical protein